ncbi:uncharacterized protein LOC133796267 [Humulus lupulus]|uniref:uncharacterized protein LOC133796267 n=1 Tax=Humulus lupulus TaxID=3486 RepID=UPI002B405F2A|nr:uncharacterized protein LOC133796267 [Humulus lupulus]
MVGSGSVAWEKLCKPKKAGGIGFMNISDWNRATLIKNGWSIATKKDNLWVKWVHNVYIKHEEWWGYNAPSQSSWYWRKMVNIKDEVKHLMDPVQFTLDTYQISSGYKLLNQVQERFHWSKEVWCRLNIPKHSFVLWIAIQNRLKTRERLHRFNITEDSTYILCNGADETVEHLFFDCSFSQDCLQQLKKWLGWRAHTESLQGLLRWTERSKKSKFQKNVLAASVAALVYHLWQAGNNKLWQSSIVSPKLLVQEAKWQIKTRIT